jgi:hypothetical protein
MSAILPLVALVSKGAPIDASRAFLLRVFLHQLIYARLAPRCALPQQRSTDKKALSFRRYPSVWSDHQKECAESNSNSTSNEYKLAKSLIVNRESNHAESEYPDHGLLLNSRFIPKAAIRVKVT